MAGAPFTTHKQRLAATRINGEQAVSIAGVLEPLSQVVADALRYREQRTKRLVPVPRARVLQVTGDDGGYRSLHCLACGERDWEMHLKHKKNCPMAGGK